MLNDAVPSLAVLMGLGRYEMANPTVPDAVMNYDGEEIRHPAAGSGFSEPDCSPLPFDILAIYAMYQSR